MKNNNLINEYNYAEDGSLILNMVVKDDSNFLSVFSIGNTPIISDDVSSFLENSTQSIPHKQSLTLKVHSDCIDDEEKVLYKRGIKKYYAERAVATEKELKRNIWIAVILAITGLAVLCIARAVEFFFDSIIWAEAIDIAAWVFLWECVDILVFKIRSLRLNRHRYYAFCNMRIEYLSLQK